MTLTEIHMENIGDDLLREILLRLPDSRQALRCSAVCKRWSSLIRATQFARSFTARCQNLDDSDFSAEIVPLLFQRPTSDFFREEAPIIANNYYNVIGETQASTRPGGYLSFLPWDDVIIRAYCSDLLLVSRLNGGRLSFCICNPMTKKYWCNIPEPPEFLDRFKCAFTCRLGNRGERIYRVTLFLDNDCPVYKMRTISFSSETGKWSAPFLVRLPTETRFIFSIFLLSEPVTCGDGLVYWAEGEYPHWDCVVAFDPLAPGNCRLIRRPAKAGNLADMNGVRLGTYRGRLRAAHITHTSVLRVWELNHASSRWSLVHRAALRLSSCEFCYPLALHSGDRNIVFLATTDSHIWQYDMSSRTGRYVDQFNVTPYQVSVYPLCSTWPTPVFSLQPK